MFLHLGSLLHQGDTAVQRTCREGNNPRCYSETPCCDRNARSLILHLSLSVLARSKVSISKIRALLHRSMEWLQKVFQKSKLLQKAIPKKFCSFSNSTKKVYMKIPHLSYSILIDNNVFHQVLVIPPICLYPPYFSNSKMKFIA